jgi:hypothetical protein
MPVKTQCEELEQLRGEAKTALLRARRIGRFSHYSDAELREEGRRRVDEMIQHLLVGHDGKPCPGGDRPIIQPERLDVVRTKAKSV